MHCNLIFETTALNLAITHLIIILSHLRNRLLTVPTNNNTTASLGFALIAKTAWNSIYEPSYGCLFFILCFVDFNKHKRISGQLLLIMLFSFGMLCQPGIVLSCLPNIYPPLPSEIIITYNALVCLGAGSLSLTQVFKIL